MERGAVVAAVLAAVLAGGATGIGLHAWRPDPLGLAGTGAEAADASPGTSGTARASASPKPRRSTGPTPTATPTATTPSPSASAEPSDDSTPAFTERALLQPANLTANGWKSAEMYKRYAGLPGGAITPCAEITTGDTGVVEGYAARYASSHTGAIELVARFSSESAAQREYSQLVNLVANCADSAYEPKLAVSESSRTVEADGVDNVQWWNTTSSDGGRGIIGIVRAQDRIAYLTMSSPDSDPDNTQPGGTTDIAAVLTVAGQRLV
ncbi:hypothetical protein FHX74_002520 [Friedmanniella endophytica]|uniref:PknH-like extracellular domain-containing protein n=1 Tax=Microlunatus kandeliicorticis TaxID=1759536 RepID=A0A7W3P6F2_9ACTN|nr:hypothetical protein [Microlunatus kandeliicorticis]MBA8794892.1 hypothetical protein [Microlunatus kandeliicorticis]